MVASIGAAPLVAFDLEFLAQVVFSDGTRAYPDTLVGTDSHTTMINGLGIVGVERAVPEAQELAAGYQAIKFGWEPMGQSEALDLELVRGYGPLASGALFVPFAVSQMVFAPRSAAMMPR